MPDTCVHKIADNLEQLITKSTAYKLCKAEKTSYASI